MHAAFCKQKTPSFAVTLFRRIVLFSPKASHFLLRLDSIWQFSLIFLFFFFFRIFCKTDSNYCMDTDFLRLFFNVDVTSTILFALQKFKKTCFVQGKKQQKKNVTFNQIVVTIKENLFTFFSKKRPNKKQNKETT
ncbi:hypothetical protein OUZ56_007687 [Daphnia magna]|uniref:Transmembrane protein n=1 Tax=Daphnia magna TaxID=35525 RepID=A0ABR0AAX2_9CRUS|nr:hypothetical protein OUZ56_007687 [Daphnia magna]